jgi:hypothetical protein
MSDRQVQANLPSPGRRRQMRIAALLSLCLVLCYFAVACYVLYIPQHIGAADNGDYWRYAETTGVSGVESFSGDEYPYAYKFYDQWKWLPFTAELLNPLRPQLSNAYPISVVRLFTNLFGDTAVNHYQLWYLSLVCIPLLLFGAYHIFRYCLLAMGKRGAVFLAAGIILVGGSTHLGYLSSFYGESMIYVWLLVLLGCAGSAIIAQKGSVSGKLFCAGAVVAAHMMLTAKGQTIVAYPIWLVVIGFLSWHHFMGGEPKPEKRRKIRNIALLGCIGAALALSGVSCVKLYIWNNDIVSSYNVYNSLLNGVLPIVDDPEEALADLGLDPALAQDSGKSAFDPDLLVPLNSELANETIFAKVGVMDIFKYYLSHPKYLYRVLQTTAEHSAEYSSQLILERYTDANGDVQYRQASKFSFWETIRPYLVPRSFILYVVIYLGLFGLCVVSLVRNRKKPRMRLSVIVFMALMLTGILQFPLPVIGNGTADVEKQLYLFMLSYDLTMLISACWLYTSLKKRFGAS